MACTAPEKLRIVCASHHAYIAMAELSALSIPPYSSWRLPQQQGALNERTPG
jgi:hypothetical protein